MKKKNKKASNSSNKKKNPAKKAAIDGRNGKPKPSGKYLPNPKGAAKKKPGANQKFSEAEVMVALTKSEGRVFTAAGLLGCTPKTVYAQAARHPNIKRILDERRGNLADESEGKLVENMRKGDNWSINRILQAFRPEVWAKPEKLELTGKDGGPINYEDVNIEARRAFLLGVIVTLTKQENSDGMPSLEHDRLVLENKLNGVLATGQADPRVDPPTAEPPGE